MFSAPTCFLKERHTCLCCYMCGAVGGGLSGGLMSYAEMTIMVKCDCELSVINIRLIAARVSSQWPGPISSHKGWISFQTAKFGVKSPLGIARPLISWLWLCSMPRIDKMARIMRELMLFGLVLHPGLSLWLILDISEMYDLCTHIHLDAPEWSPLGLVLIILQGDRNSMNFFWVHVV